MKKIILFFTILMFLSCEKENPYKTIAQKIVNYSHAKSVEIKPITKKVLGVNQPDVFVITIKDVWEIDKNNYNPELLASFAAKVLFDDLKRLAPNDHYKSIQTIIYSKKKKLTYSFAFENLTLIENCYKTASNFSKALYKEKPEYLYESFIDKKEIEKDVFIKDFHQNFIWKNRKMFRRIKEVQLEGFFIINEKNKDFIEIITSTIVEQKRKVFFSTLFIKNGNGSIIGYTVFQ